MKKPELQILRSALLHATRPGTWILGAPTGNFYVGAEDYPRPLIYARGRDKDAELQGYTDLLYAIAAANAVPQLLKERDEFLEGIEDLYDYINMAAAYEMGEPPMEYGELVRSIMDKLEKLFNSLSEDRKLRDDAD